MLQRQTTAASLIDVLDRVLDKGIVIDAWVALSLVGINLVTIDAILMRASLFTRLMPTPHNAAHASITMPLSTT